MQTSLVSFFVSWFTTTPIYQDYRLFQKHGGRKQELLQGMFFLRVIAMVPHPHLHMYRVCNYKYPTVIPLPPYSLAVSECLVYVNQRHTST